jgi:PhzF family phenazine biosynthesis protein
LKTTLRVAEALRLPATHLHELMPARVARRGGTRLLVPVAGREYLNDLAPNFDTLNSLGTELGADGFFVFALDEMAEGMSTESRMFCPALGIPEDPVSGNAHAMLAAYLWDVGAFDDKPANFLGEQGRHMGRPGEVHVRLEVRNGEMDAVHIGGAAIIVSEGTLAL